jgi:orotate phosphoribosyltransferase
VIYISYAQLAEDVHQWSRKLPRNLDVVIGVARSGILPATILALHRNIRLTTVDNLKDGRLFRGGHRDQHKKVLRGLVVDDSILTGKSLEAARQKLSHVKGMHLEYGGVYMKPGLKYLHHKVVPIPRIFEWNWLHHYWLSKACMDIDGVLCRDPTREENDDGVRYRQFLAAAEPLHLPTVEVHTLVTSRLEKYREETVRWLHRHGVRYTKLLMHPAKTKKERQLKGDHAARKAKVYSNPEYQLFVESDDRQAGIINARTKKPVLCTDTGAFFA